MTKYPSLSRIQTTKPTSLKGEGINRHCGVNCELGAFSGKGQQEARLSDLEGPRDSKTLGLYRLMSLPNFLVGKWERKPQAHTKSTPNSFASSPSAKEGLQRRANF